MKTSDEIQEVSEDLEEWARKDYLKKWRLDTDRAIQNLRKRTKEMRQYAELIYTVSRVDVSEDTGFQKKFTAFYGIRRDSEWNRIYFELFEECKANPLNKPAKVRPVFNSILRELYERTGRIEPAAASAMIATVDPSKPVWDSLILSHTRVESGNSKLPQVQINRLSFCYFRIESWFESCFKYGLGEEPVAAFDRAFPQYRAFSDLKKIDLLLRASGKREPNLKRVVKVTAEIRVPRSTTREEFLEKFNAFVESNGWGYWLNFKFARNLVEEEDVEEDGE